jgi:hypothetical protein
VGYTTPKDGLLICSRGGLVLLAPALVLLQSLLSLSDEPYLESTDDIIVLFGRNIFERAENQTKLLSSLETLTDLHVFDAQMVVPFRTLATVARAFLTE